MKEKEQAPGRRARREVLSLTNEVIHESKSSFEELSKRDLDTKTAWDVARTIDNLEAKVKKVQRFRDTLMKRYANCDEEGNVIIHREADGKTPKTRLLPNGQRILDIDWRDKEGFDREIEKLANEKQDIKVYRVHIDDIGKITKPETLKGLRWYLLTDDGEEDEAEEADSDAVDEDDE